MERSLAEGISRKLRIDIVQVVREFWEVVVLKGLFDAPDGKVLIFKGGTALRLVYGSPRFSEGLDFSLTGGGLKRTFRSLVEKVVSPYLELSITDLKEKHYTYLAEIRVKEDYLPHPFRIKIEISKRKERGYRSELALISSPVSTVQCLGRVATLARLYKDKLACMAGRAKPKDVFDLWYISQKLKKPYVPESVSVPEKELVRDMRKYLPANFWPVIDNLRR